MGLLTGQFIKQLGSWAIIHGRECLDMRSTLFK